MRAGRIRATAAATLTFVLSQTYLEAIEAQEVFVPLVSFRADAK